MYFLIVSSETDYENIFWQFKPDTFKYNEATTTGNNATRHGHNFKWKSRATIHHISSNSEAKIPSNKMLEVERFLEMLKVYNKPNTYLFKQIKLKRLSHSILETMYSQKRDLH